MLTNLQRVINEDISNRTNQLDVILEGITNAIHANATVITCHLTCLELPLLTNSTDEEFNPERKVDTIKVTDNGDGFTTENYQSFGIYRTDFKQNKFGCKGVGRLAFLKVYKEAKFESFVKSENKHKKFVFTVNFESEDIKSKTINVDESKTILELTTLKRNYHDPKKRIDRRIILNIDAIKDSILLNLTPTLFFYKDIGREINIDIVDTQTNDTVSITVDDIPNFNKRSFLVKSNQNEDFEFTLYYDINTECVGTNAYYCANMRTVCEFHDKDFKLSLPNKYSAFLLLSSNYFDEYVDNERNDFKIHPKTTDLYQKLSWDDINSELRNCLSTIIKQEIPNSDSTNKAKLAEIENERPYLLEYIDEDDINVLGFINKDSIIKKAKKRFESAKDKLIRHSGKKEYSEEDLQEAIQIAQNELVAYIHDRTMVIERLKAMFNKKEKNEKIIHNLFMERYTDDAEYSIGKNNLWLLDDRFISYSYAASDKRIHKILSKFDEKTNTKYDLDRPDIALFFSHNPNNKSALKAAVVEIKPFDYKNKPGRQKFAGLQQLLDNIEAFKEAEQIQEIWAFLITEIDEDLANRLTRDGYAELFSTDRPIYYRSFGNSSIYVVCVKTLIADAEARNKIFLNIINKNSRLKKILNPNQPPLHESRS
ncbi:ATP-binding protein [Pseudodesulfovibrio indicus]|nr:ATP-binding protein [Pseudodesulfovibrio indicus]